MTLSFFSPTAPRGGVVGVAVLLAGLSAGILAPPARAGQLDRMLLKSGVDVLAALHKKGYENVGVLPFEVTRGSRKASIAVAPLSLNLPTRLENVLIMWQDPKGSPIGIVRGAAATSGLTGPPATQAEFLKLFAEKYPLAWGKKQVKAAAFLTGTVENAGDRSKTTVTVNYFDADCWKDGKLVLKKACRFRVDTDRALLSDLGYPWAIKPAVLKRSLRLPRDREVVKLVARAEAEKDLTEVKDVVVASPDSVGGFKLEVEYDGKKQEILPFGVSETARLPMYRLPRMPAGVKNIALVLTRVDDSDRTLGVVLKVNGQSTYAREDRENVLCRKWLYSPKWLKKPDRFDGFSIPKGDEVKVFKFKSLTDDQFLAQGGKPNSRLGWIDLEVFAGNPDGSAREKARKVDPEEEDMSLISTRSTASGGDSSDLVKLRVALRDANNIDLKPISIPRSKKTPFKHRDVIDAELAPFKSVKVKKGDRLPNPESLGSISILYQE